MMVNKYLMCLTVLLLVVHGCSSGVSVEYLDSDISYDVKFNKGGFYQDGQISYVLMKFEKRNELFKKDTGESIFIFLKFNQLGTNQKIETGKHTNPFFLHAIGINVDWGTLDILSMNLEQNEEVTFSGKLKTGNEVRGREPHPERVFSIQNIALDKYDTYEGLKSNGYPFLFKVMKEMKVE